MSTQLLIPSNTDTFRRHASKSSSSGGKMKYSTGGKRYRRHQVLVTLYPYRRSTLALKPVTYSREPAQTTLTSVALSHRSLQITIFYVRLNAMERRSGSFEVVSFIEWKPKGSLLWVYGKRCVPATVFRACAFSRIRILSAGSGESVI